MIYEKRLSPIDMRQHGRRLEGYAATFGTEGNIEGRFIEVIAPGAFRSSLATSGDILALVDHDPTRLLARTRSGTLRLSEDAHGLAFEITLPETSVGNDILALAERGDLGGMSFGFTVNPGGEERSTGRRILKSVNLLEISVVTAFPAYSGTSVGARSQSRLNMAKAHIGLMQHRLPPAPSRIAGCENSANLRDFRPRLSPSSNKPR